MNICPVNIVVVVVVAVVPALDIFAAGDVEPF